MDPQENDSVKSKMSHSKVFCKKEIVKYFVKHTGKILCRSPYFIELLVFSQQFIKKKTPAQMICLKIRKKINNKFLTELELQMNSSGRAIHFSKNESNSYCQYFQRYLSKGDSTSCLLRSPYHIFVCISMKNSNNFLLLWNFSAC